MIDVAMDCGMDDIAENERNNGGIQNGRNGEQ
jgi:hypothetical protein